MKTVSFISILFAVMSLSAMPAMAASQAEINRAARCIELIDGTYVHPAGYRRVSAGCRQFLRPSERPGGYYQMAGDAVRELALKGESVHGSTLAIVNPRAKMDLQRLPVRYRVFYFPTGANSATIVIPEEDK